MGTSLEMIDKHYGHLLADADETIPSYLTGDLEPASEAF